VNEDDIADRRWGNP